MYVLFKKLLRPIKDARRVLQIVLRFLIAIPIQVFPHHTSDLIFFARIFKSNSSSDTMKKMFSTLHLPVVFFKSKITAGIEALKTRRQTDLPVEYTLTLTRWEADVLLSS